MRRALPYTFLHRRLGSKAFYDASSAPRVAPAALRPCAPHSSRAEAFAALEERVRYLETRDAVLANERKQQLENREVEWAEKHLRIEEQKERRESELLAAVQERWRKETLHTNIMAGVFVTAIGTFVGITLIMS